MGPPRSWQGSIPPFLQRQPEPPIGTDLELALANAMREINAHQCGSCGPIGLGAQHGPAPALERPVILLNGVDQVLAVAHQDVLPASVLATMPPQSPGPCL